MLVPPGTVLCMDHWTHLRRLVERMTESSDESARKSSDGEGGASDDADKKAK